MNTKLLIGVSIIGGLLLGGCQPQGPVSSQLPNKPQQSTQSAGPAVNSSPKTATMSDTDEVKAIDNEFNNIDASKDFPDFTASDLQQ